MVTAGRKFDQLKVKDKHEQKNKKKELTRGPTSVEKEPSLACLLQSSAKVNARAVTYALSQKLLFLA